MIQHHSYIYFDSDMSKSTNTVVYLDWKTVIYIYICCQCRTQFMLPNIMKAKTDSNMPSFFRFVNKRAIYRLGIISLVHVHVTDFPVINVHVDELSSARIWQHKLCATLTANVNINYRLPIKVYYKGRHVRICFSFPDIVKLFLSKS
jgi:hypothetical protein